MLSLSAGDGYAMRTKSIIVSSLFWLILFSIILWFASTFGWRPVLVSLLRFLWGTFVLCLLGGTVAWLCFVYQSAIDRKAVPVDGRLAGLIYIIFMVGIITLILSVLKGESFEWLQTCFGLFPPLKYR